MSTEKNSAHSKWNISRALTIIQAASGLTFQTFLTLHFLTHLSANISIDRANALIKVFRTYYQNPAVEGVVVAGSAFVHIVSSFAKVYLRRRLKASLDEANKDKMKEKRAGPLLELPSARQLHHWAGYFLAFFIIPHTFGTRFGPDVPAGGMDMYGIRNILIHEGMVFYPGYILAASAGIYHMVLGGLWGLRNLSFIKILKSKNQGRIVNCVIIVSTLGVISSLLTTGGLW
ncbi:uncharacterized protein VTP21DRAFT_3833 [Calcarisporiella thermophila]|uniref:uncharacterized protein n=1 Tax=Calcarisporiella thermophila TaxID=911321 RepID=UPI003741FD55